MTIAQAIRQAQLAKPSAAGREQYLYWLGQVEAAVAAYMQGCTGSAPPGFAGYDTDTPDETVLLAPDPYSRLYPHYLCAQQDLLNQEFDLYANNAALYNRAWMEFCNYYTRSHLPLQRAVLCGKRG